MEEDLILLAEVSGGGINGGGGTGFNTSSAIEIL
jgi:hypothetical protein